MTKMANCCLVWKGIMDEKKEELSESLKRAMLLNMAAIMLRHKAQWQKAAILSSPRRAGQLGVISAHLHWAHACAVSGLRAG